MSYFNARQGLSVGTTPTNVIDPSGNASFGTISSSGQYTNTVTTGTAPFVVSSTTPVANLSIGGNAATATHMLGGAAGQISYQSGVNTTAFTAAGTASQVLIGGATPSWTNAPAISGASITNTTIPIAAINATGTANSSTYLRGDGQWATTPAGFANPMTTQGDIMFGGASGTATRLAAGTANQVLISGSSPSWTGTPSLTSLSLSGQFTSTLATGTAPFVVASTTPVANLSIGGNAATATNVAGGAVGQIHYQSGVGTTAFLGANTSTTPQFVTSTGNGSAGLPPTLTSSTGSGNVVLATSPTISGATLSGSTSVAAGTTLTVPSTAAIAVASGATLTITDAPVNATDAANKGYVDLVAQGFQSKGAARAATTGTLPSATYNNGSSGVGATLTAVANGALPAQDGVTLVAGDYLLVKDQSPATQNGLYVVTAVGNAGAPWVLTRSTNLDLSTEFKGAYIVIEREGTTNKNGIFLCDAVANVTVGTTNIAFNQINGATTLVQGSGITISGNTVSLTNNSLTLGSTSMALGSTTTTVAGLSSVSSTTFVGALTGNASTATSLAAGSTGALPYQSAAGTTAYLAAGTTSQVLIGGAGGPTWSNTPTLTGTNFTGIPNGALTNSSVTIGSTTVSLGGTQTAFSGLTTLSMSGQLTSTLATGTAPFVVASTTPVTNLSIGGNAGSATNLQSGTVGAIPYQTGPGATTFLAGNVPSTTAVLTSTGTGAAAQAPVWTGTTGSGNVVMSTSPTLTTPVLGVASATSLEVNSLCRHLANTLTTTSTTAGQVLVSSTQTIFRAVKYVIQAVNATSGYFQATEILAIHNGNTTVDFTEYASVQVGGQCGAFTVTANGTNMVLTVTPSSANSTVFKVSVTGILV